MKAAVLEGVEKMVVRKVVDPAPLPNEVLLRVKAVGVCGTDLHLFRGHGNYHLDSRGRPIPLEEQPQILGHEFSGEVVEAGREVKDLRPGDRVLCDQGRNCHSQGKSPLCVYCCTGDSHQCELYAEHGITGLPGGLAEFIAVPAVNAVHIRSELDMAEAALTEPLGCIIHSADAAARAQTRYHLNGAATGPRVRSVLICGAGPAGLMFVQYLRRVLGYDGLLLVSEPNEQKRKLAARLCADQAIDPGDRDAVEAVQDYTSGKGVDCLIEALGAGQVLVL